MDWLKIKESKELRFLQCILTARKRQKTRGGEAGGWGSMQYLTVNGVTSFLKWNLKAGVTEGSVRAASIGQVWDKSVPNPYPLI